MSDITRELHHVGPLDSHGRPIAALDRISDEEELAELEEGLAYLKGGGDHAPWVTREEAIQGVEKEIARMREKAK